MTYVIPNISVGRPFDLTIIAIDPKTRTLRRKCDAKREPFARNRKPYGHATENVNLLSEIITMSILIIILILVLIVVIIVIPHPHHRPQPDPHLHPHAGCHPGCHPHPYRVRNVNGQNVKGVCHQQSSSKYNTRVCHV